MPAKKISEVEIIKIFKQMEDEPTRRQELCGRLVKKLSYIPCTLVAKYKYFTNYPDLKQTAYETFVKSIWTFDYHKSSNFKGWSWWWVRKEVAKAALKEKRYLEGYRPLNFSRMERAQSYIPEDILINLEQELIIKNILSGLDRREQFVIEKSFGIEDGKSISLRKLGEELNISHESVRKIRNNAVLKVAKEYSKTQ